MLNKMNVDEHTKMEENIQEITGITFEKVSEVSSLSRGVLEDYENRGE